MRKNHRIQGFTIVELLIVVVVIAILAAIALVSYNGITNRAQSASIQSSLTAAKKKIETVRITSGLEQYPGDLSNVQLSSSSGIQFIYASNNTTSPYGFCLQGTQNNVTYSITESTTPAAGPCAENFGIAGWWKLNGNGSDSGAKNWVMTTAGTPSSTAGQNGQNNNAYSFNGSSQSFSANGFNTNGNTYGALSISGWVYPTSSAPASAQGYFGFRNSLAPQAYIAQKAGGTALECRIWPSTAGTYVDAGSVSITVSTWNFVTMVYDGSNVKCYVNGVSGSATSASGSYAFTGEPFTIGRTNTAYFNGRLDDLRVYSRILTDEEIQSLYTAGAQ